MSTIPNPIPAWWAGTFRRWTVEVITYCNGRRVLLWRTPDRTQRPAIDKIYPLRGTVEATIGRAIDDLAESYQT